MNETTDAILRCFVDNGRITKQDERTNYFDKNFIFICDCETSTDIYENLLWGYYSVFDLQNNNVHDCGLFYGEVLTKTQIKILENYAKSNKLKLMARKDFVIKFVEYVYHRRAICSGFNIPYDLTRICIDFSTSKRDHDGFSIRLSDDRFMPRLFIKSINSKRAFINFIPPYFKNRRKKHNYSGTFCDLRTVIFATTGKGLTLEKSCELFNVEHKKTKLEKYGEVTPEAIMYCVNDVICVFDLYKVLIKEIEKYGIPLEPSKLSSPASIGKQYFKYMNVKPFFQQNPNFPKPILGAILTAYYGSRTEIHIRKDPTKKISNMDIFSTYPLQWVLQNLTLLLTANEIVVEEDKSIQDFVKNIELKDLNNKDIWRQFSGIALVETDDDIFPLRAKYGDKVVPNISFNHIKGKTLWYAYPDVIASFLLTKKVPRIIKAYKFLPKNSQTELIPAKLFDNFIDLTKTDFIKMLIEHRLCIKEKLKTDPDNETLKSQYLATKLIANSASYGIWVETSVTSRPSRAHIYGLENYEKQIPKTERYGKVFNPIISVLLTSGARLQLAMIEAFARDHQGYYSMMDTDSVFIGPASLVEPLKAYFKKLNPFDRGIDVIKVEDGDDKKPLYDIYTYAISSKRYCCFSFVDNDIKILKHSSHGLGYITSMPKNWEIDFWKDIVKYHYKLVTGEEIENKYGNYVVASKLAITSPILLKRFKKFGSKDITHRIKPFNFMTVGISACVDKTTKSAVVPLLPFTKDYSTIKYQPFVDYKTGKYYENNTQFYWKSIADLFFEYINHREQKYDGSVGELRRKHIVIGDVRYIGKETSSNLDETEIMGVQNDDLVFYDKDFKKKIAEKIQTLKKDDALNCGISNWQYNYIKRQLKEGKVPKFKKKTLRLLGLL